MQPSPRKLENEHNHENIPSKFLAYIPILSQLTSIFHCLRGRHKLSCEYQKLQLQCLIDIIKLLIHHLHILFCCIRNGPPTTRPATKRDITQLIDSQNHHLNLSSWMSNTGSKHISLSSLCLPGTHNSHAYRCVRPTPVGTDWVLCQQLSILEQLRLGVRLLDWRVSNDYDDGYNYFAHGVATTTSIRGGASDVVEFLRWNRSEVVVCLVKWNNGSPKKGNQKSSMEIVEDALIRARDDVCGDNEYSGTNDNENAKDDGTNYPIRIERPINLETSNRLKNVPIAQLTSNGTRGCVIIDDWSHWRGSWKETRSNRTSDVKRKCEEWVAMAAEETATKHTNNNHNIGKPRLLELVVTVDAGTIGKTIGLAVVHSIKSLNVELVRKLEEEEDKLLSAAGLHGLQGVILDYPTVDQIRSIVLYNLGVSGLVDEEMNGGMNKEQHT